MPTAVEISESLRSRIADDGGNTLNRRFFLADLNGSGLDRFLGAWNLLGTTVPGRDGGPAVTLPRANDRVIFAGAEVFAKEMDLEPWADADAVLSVGYREDNTDLSGFDGIELECGTTLEQDETDFDGVEIEKPFVDRIPMYVLYDPANTVPADTEANRKRVRLPKWVGKSFRRFTRTLGEDPSPLGETFAGMTNKTTWKGYPPETVMCISIVGRNAGRGWRTTLDVAIDRIGRFRQIGIAENEATGRPVTITQAMVANVNGINEFRVQGQRQFNALPF